MNELSFEIRTTSDFFKKLLEDYKEFCVDTTSTRKALNCAMTAWHLTDWTYNEFYQQLTSQFAKLSSYQQNIKKLCPSMQIMHDLTNGTKHSRLTHHNPVIKETNLHLGAFSDGFSRGFDISTLDIELKDGSKLFFEDEMQKVIDFWHQYLTIHFSLSI